MSGSLLVDTVTWLVFAYFLLQNGGYLALNLLAIGALRRSAQQRVLDELPHVYAALEIPVSIVVPVQDGEGSVKAAVRALLQLDYAEYEVVVVNDGSRDGTLAALIAEFALQPFPEALRVQLASKPVRTVYQSARYPNLRVIDKDRGGKADALNAGINASRYPLVCTVDSGAILKRDCLQRLVRPFLDDADMVLSGGAMRVANGCQFKDGELASVGLPDTSWAMFQVVEYLRAFLFGRLGWAAMSGMLTNTCALNLCRKETVVTAGGFRDYAGAEDTELLLRLHRTLRARGQDYRVAMLPDPVCWTPVPDTLAALRKQRREWQRGLCRAMAANRSLMFSRGGGLPGWGAFPFVLLFEAFGPALELGGYLFMAGGYLLGAISLNALLLFLFLAIGLGMLLSVSALLLEEMSFHLYPKGSQLLRLGAAVVLENFGYRQLQAWWRLRGIWR